MTLLLLTPDTPIECRVLSLTGAAEQVRVPGCHAAPSRRWGPRSEEHTSELQSQSNLVCRLLLEKKTKPILPLRHHRHDLRLLKMHLFCPFDILNRPLLLLS